MELEKGQTTFEFCPLPVRVFRTIEVDLSAVEDPQAKLLAALQPELIQDAVVRLVYHLRADQLDQIDSVAVHQALTIAHNYTIQPELVSQLARPRLPELGVGTSIAPLDALKTYLTNREDLQEIEAEILDAAQNLLAEDGMSWFALPEADVDAKPMLHSTLAEVPEAENTQLRLL
ncbi:hypothetical protein [Kovacikia minuta]|uniref:hypothetical protein n=1 Tax=Kovacikia minuta TaxID=2931930 RepID=UPI0036F3B8BD